jgi:hypothetical protein
MVVNPVSGPGSERTLGFWPDDFKTRYQAGSNVSRLGAERGRALKVAQRHHDQNIEIRTAKSAGREAQIPDVAVRRQRLKEDFKTLQSIKNERLAIEANAITAKENLRPFDYSKSTIADATLRAEYRQMLRSADDKTRAELLRKAAYRQAAFEGDHSLTGLSNQQYDQLWDHELRTRFPAEMQAYDDHATAQDATRLAYEAAEAALRNEAKAIGEPLDGSRVEPTPKPDWE